MAAWYQTHITQAFKWGWSPGGRGQPGTVNGHSGIDLAETNGTPLTAAVTGQVVASGARAWGGQVSILFDAGNNTQMVCTTIHMSDIAPGIVEGAHVVAGQIIGKTGGASWSSPIPTTCCSTGPHLHFELSMGNEPPYWHSYEPYKPDKQHYPVDPTNFWLSLKANGIPNDQSALGAALPASYNPTQAQSEAQTAGTANAPISDGPGAQAHNMLVELPGFAGIVLALDRVEQFTAFSPPPASSGDASINVGPFSGTISIPVISGAIDQELTIGYTFQWFLANVAALLVRAFVMLAGAALIFALLYALARRSSLMPDAGDVARVAPLAALE